MLNKVCKLSFFLLTFSWFLFAKGNSDKLSTVIQWNQLQFAYPSETARQNDINAGLYNPSLPGTIDVDVYYQSPNQRLVFVSIPKWTPGVPVTFGLVGNQTYKGDPVIEPFPSWQWHRNTSRCSNTRLVSVFRVKIDRCGFLWILDSGNEGNGVICKPQLVVFDLKQWPAIKTPFYRYEFPESVYVKDSVWVTPVIQSRGADCLDTRFVYVSDTTQRAIIVTDLSSEYSWRVKDDSMNPEMDFTNFSVAGESFSSDDGILGMALSPENKNDNGVLFYSVLAGTKTTGVGTTDLQNSLNYPPRYYKYQTPRKSQSAALAISRRGVAFFGLVSNITMNCWNIYSNDYGKYIHTVYSNPITMQFASGVKVVENCYGEEELWVMTPRFQKLANNNYNFSEVNFRISRGYVDDLLEESKCLRPNL